MFFVSQKIHIKRSPNATKIYEELLWNICDFWELESTQMEAHSHHNTRGCARQPRPVVVYRALLVSRLELYFRRKEAYIQKNHVKISAQSELQISQNIRNGFRPENRNAKHKITEREIQSWRGSRPSAAMEAMDQRGNSPPI